MPKKRASRPTRGPQTAAVFGGGAADIFGGAAAGADAPSSSRPPPLPFPSALACPCCGLAEPPLPPPLTIRHKIGLIRYFAFGAKAPIDVRQAIRKAASAPHNEDEGLNRILKHLAGMLPDQRAAEALTMLEAFAHPKSNGGDIKRYLTELDAGRLAVEALDVALKERMRLDCPPPVL